ncbi:MAG TPA: PaaX family transcriptional regulator C-terminal domain-containing protein [Segeticoccus sp.]|uniref:PaaX family transcriptional regulator n=1 Tax=Segeticoccus sp. TaxID=2706531 RepID=UPI002D801F50|nr:PaaX family transcriptional regulator C-terminal domain-containing protein [Segeticoccus sp.]HET8599133.1 PaaX family transcriptional regulator C-terminal domain-containing protein [Segeticoccus sp.]
MATTPQQPDAGRMGTARQRNTSAPSARSLLLTILGEFVHTRSGSIWTGTLVSALATLGVEEKSARQALSRTAADGLLSSERHGRKVMWTLTEAGAQLLQEGTERIYGFMRRPHAWDGRWLVLTVGVPESQRRLRHRLRTRLTWLGMGSPTPGLWVVPEPAKRDAVAAVLAELGLTARAFAWIGESAQVGEPAKLIAAAWDLDDVEKRYLTFIDQFEGVHAPTDHEAFVNQVHLIHEWRSFPFLDPDLPAELLRHDWPGPRAAATFHTQRDRWHRRAQAEWDRMESQAATRN